MAAQLPPLTPKKVLVVVAHPDDIEFCCGGSVAVWIDGGATVEYLICTDGSRGTSTNDLEPKRLAAKRREEQEAAAKALGVEGVHFLEYGDGLLQPTREVKRDIVRHICRFEPDTVVTFDPSFVYSVEHQMVNHTDHRAAGQAALDAVYPLARDDLHFPELKAEGLLCHKVEHLLLINFNQMNHFVDIASTFARKVEALGKHASQMNDMDHVRERVRSQAASYGQQAGCELAEGFVRLDLAV